MTCLCVCQVFDIVEPVLVTEFIKPTTMATQLRDGQRFRHHPFALYALDVKFQPAFRPGGRFNEKKHYFSGKHKLYGFKVECAVALPGVAVHVSRHYTGAVSDLSIALENKDTHKAMLKKTEDEQNDIDYAEGAPAYPSSWAILADKGYQGLQSALRTIHPKKKPRGGELTVEDFERNSRVSSDRVIVENYFGRVCSLWRTMSSTFSWNESRYDQLVRLCFSLTNFHVSFYPLRASDTSSYEKQMARYVSMALQDAKKRARAAVTARARKVARTSNFSSFGRTPGSSVSSGSSAFSPGFTAESQSEAFSQAF